jgi:oligosaccharide repeat unit polymerase
MTIRRTIQKGFVPKFNAFFRLVLVGMGVLLVNVMVDWRLRASRLAVVILLALVLLMPIVLRLRKGRFELFEPIVVFSLVYAVFFVLPPIADFFNAPTYIDDPKFIEMITLVFVGAFAFYVGYWVHSCKSLARKLPGFSPYWDGRHLSMLILVYSIIGVVCLGLLADSVGGALYFVTHLGERSDLLSGKTYLIWGMELIPAAFLVWAAFSFAIRKWTLLFWVYGIGAVCLLFAFGVRVRLLPILMVLIVLYHYLVRRIKPIALFVLMTIGILIFVYIPSQRTNVYVLNVDAFTSLDKFYSIMFEARNINLYRDLLIVLNGVPSERPYLYGATYAAFLVMPIPRVLWPAKPVGMGVIYPAVFLPELAQNNISVGPTCLGELYWNFGWLGIVCGMMLFGFACRVMWEYCVMHSRHAGAIVVLGLSALAVGMEIRGEFGSMTEIYLMYLLSVVVGIIVVTGTWGRERGRVRLSV